MTLLKIENLKVQFQVSKKTVYAVNSSSFSLEEGETIGIVGESGSGKSVSMLSIMQLLPKPPICKVGGRVIFRGKDLLLSNNSEMSRIRGREIAMIYQDPGNSLNPVLRIGTQIMEALEWHLGKGRVEAKLRTIKILEDVGISDARSRINDYPFQFSGGMCQRVMIALALSCDPKLLIADEPTTSLDVTIQSQIIELIKNLRDKTGMSVIWVTHDLSVISGLADRILVMYGGNIVEVAPVDKLYSGPCHPYTKKLLAAIPRLDVVAERLEPILGVPPNMEAEPVNCPFYKRCEFKIERCYYEKPELCNIGDDHLVACWVDIKKVMKNDKRK